MANSKTPNSKQSFKPRGRGLAYFLIGAIVCVLGFGAWLMLSWPQPPSITAPLPDPVATLGEFYMPAEFETQEMLYLGGESLATQDPDLMTAIVRAAAPELKVIALHSHSQGRAATDSLLAANAIAGVSVVSLSIPEISPWVRDFGPLTVTDADGRRSLVEFRSGTRRGTRFDDSAADFLAVKQDLALLRNRLQIEGGDVLTNGRGFGVLSARAIELNTAAGDKEPHEVIHTVAAMLGFEHVLPVPALMGEESGHLDIFCTFLAVDLVMVGNIDPAVDAGNAAQLDMIAADLAGQPTLGGPLRVVRIPQPDHNDGVWRSYTSVVWVNGVVLVPIYPDYCPQLDTQALEMYRRLLPEGRFVGVDASRLARRGGSLRGVTLNVPVGGPLIGGE